MVNAVFVFDLFCGDFRRFVAYGVDFLLDLREDGCLFEKPHIHIDPAFDVNFLVERVEVASHLFVILGVC